MMISPFDCRFRCCFERDFASLLHSPYTQLILPSASHSKASWSNNSFRNGVYWVLLHDVAIHHHRLSCSQSICWGDKFVHDFRDFNRKYVEGPVGLLIYVMVSIWYHVHLYRAIIPWRLIPYYHMVSDVVTTRQVIVRIYNSTGHLIRT